MIPDAIGIIGLGLIGGSLAKTVHRIFPQIKIIACDPDEASLRQAMDEGILSAGSPRITGDFADCRYVFLCAPVQKNESYLKALAPFLSKDCILTDTGSVKSAIHAEVDAMGLSAYFIGGHPMAGSEKSGYQNATPYLFENAYYIITYNEATSWPLVEEYRDFIASLGCIPSLMSPEAHDFYTAAVSHLPHILAAGLVQLVRELDDPSETMKAIAAGGFKDITRIASSSPTMWQEICCANREQILRMMYYFQNSMGQFRDAIARGDEEEILSFFQEAKDYRDSLPLSRHGSLPSIYEIYCDLIDETGQVAKIATILADNGINIKNIGIIHNREFEEGVLRIEFYGEDAMEQAAVRLREHHYAVYERP